MVDNRGRMDKMGRTPVAVEMGRTAVVVRGRTVVAVETGRTAVEVVTDRAPGAVETGTMAVADTAEEDMDTVVEGSWGMENMPDSRVVVVVVEKYNQAIAVLVALRFPGVVAMLVVDGKLWTLSYDHI